LYHSAQWQPRIRVTRPPHSSPQRPLHKAFLRGAALPGISEVLTVTNRDLFFKTNDEFREVNAAKLKTSFVLEPFPWGRTTSCVSTTSMGVFLW
jgi:mannose-1-phosphate guanylyltransferase